MRDGLCEETKHSLLPPIGALLSPEWVAPVEPCPTSEMKCYVDTSVLRVPDTQEQKQLLASPH